MSLNILLKSVTHILNSFIALTLLVSTNTATAAQEEHEPEFHHQEARGAWQTRVDPADMSEVADQQGDEQEGSRQPASEPAHGAGAGRRRRAVEVVHAMRWRSSGPGGP